MGRFKVTGDDMRTLKKLFILTTALFVADIPSVMSGSLEFSAEAVVSLNQQDVRKTQLFVGEHAVRRDMLVNGYRMTEIVFPEQGLALLINDHTRSFQERTFPGVSKETSESPCGQIKDSVCEKTGEETIDGIKTEKWQIVSDENNRKTRTLHWIDKDRKLAIREFFPDGSVAELKMIKKEKVNSRDVEKWERTLSRPDGQTIKSYQWYDTKLKIAVKEELPNGFYRELVNIKVGKQPPDLFEPPVGYIKEHAHKQSRY